ncbi:MAG: hypothetical protein A2Y15_01520 [Clostridiales bacterium GWF2_36_10]|nr:MAG: hypothetical protein A2Y15_01520 [Clostridiales bacterium GWF2_36_10]HAN22127.1 hypothetical protein [Clostridiales bacterium]
MFCAQCGKQMKDTDKFCPICGKATVNVQTNEPLVNEQPQQPQPQEQAQPQQQYPYNAVPQKKKPNYSIIVIAAIAIIAIAYYIYNSYINSGGASTPEKAVEGIFDSFVNEDVDKFVKYSTLNPKVYEELYDKSYDEDDVTDEIEGIFDEYDYTSGIEFEIDDTDTLNDDEFDEYIGYLETEFNLQDTDSIEKIAIVYNTIKYDDDELEDGELNLYCFLIDGKWYVLD